MTNIVISKDLEKYIAIVDEVWNSLSKDNVRELRVKALPILEAVLDLLDQGKLKVCYKTSTGWQINYWLKRAIVLYLKLSNNTLYSSHSNWYDKVDQKFSSYSDVDYQREQIRAVPGAIVRKGAFIGKNTVLMPSFINIGAHVGNFTLIDSWATIGSCAYVGNHCHISGGSGIGGVLEPIQNTPVIIEDNCFIGARSEIAEGVIIGRGSVLGMGVFISSSTKIVYRDSGKVIYGKIPPYSVVISGSIASNMSGTNLYCAVIVKQVDSNTRSKTRINDLLRY